MSNLLIAARSRTPHRQPADRPPARTQQNELVDELHGARTVLAVTHGPTPGLGRSRQAASRLAAALDATLVLADRTLETWGDTPHVVGPRAGTTIAGTPFAPLEPQVRAARADGVGDVRVVGATIPTLDAAEDTVGAVDADVLVVPARPPRRPFLRRWVGEGDLVGRLGRSHPALRIVFVHADGRCSLVGADRTPVEG